MRCMAACRLLFTAAGKPNKSSLHFEMKTQRPMCRIKQILYWRCKNSRKPLTVAFLPRLSQSNRQKIASFS